jgi:uncharacterized protein (TIGR03435 family)
LLTATGLLVVATPVVIGFLDATQTCAQSQGQHTAPIAPVFEVASIKPNKYGSSPFRLGLWGERFSATGMTLQGLVREAFAVEDDQIAGEPHWLNSESYEIETKVDQSIADQLHRLSFDQRLVEYRRMLQTLLTDRFKLTFHWETKELPVYALVVAKKGPKIEEAKPGDTYPNGMKDLDGNGHGDIMRVGRGVLIGQGVSIAFLVRMLSQQQLGRPVSDRTGLTGKYNFSLQWTPDVNQAPMLKRPDGGWQPSGSGVSPEFSGPSIFTAIQEQLGLKLEPEKGPVQILVIDHVEKPSEN